MTLLLVPAAALALAACADNSGMTDEDAAAIREQIEQVVSRLEAVEDRLNDVSEQDGETVLISDVRDVEADVSEAKNMLNDVSQRLSEAEQDAADDMAPAGDPLNDPLNDPLDGGAEPGIGDDIEQGLDNLGNNVEQGLDNLNDNVDEGLDNLNDNANESLDNLNDGELDTPNNDADLNGGDALDSDPLEDPLVPAPESDQPGL